jgi:asparagine synthase (glutamine-hydrolysing)
VTLFNDRSGLHRVYYHESNDAFYFAVEAKAILAVRPDLSRIDPQGLGEYLTCGCVLENRSLFSGIRVLPPGSAWTFRNGALEDRKSYFRPSEWEQQEPLDPNTYYETLRNVFSRNLPRYFKGSNPIGMSVTGGLDTRMIMAWWPAPPGSIPCYSFAGTYRDSHDVRLGRQVARIWGQSHTRVEVGEAFLSQFPKYAERTVFLSDGCADVSCAPILYTNELVRAIAPTRMTGNYGSEVIRGSRMFKAVGPLPGLFCSELTPYFARARDTYAGVAASHQVTFAVTRQATWHNYGLFALEGTQLTVRSPFLDNDLVQTVFRSPASCYSSPDVCLRLIADGNPVLRGIRTDRGVGEVGIGGVLTRSLLEFSFKVDYAYNHGMPQWLAGIDHLLSPFRFDRLFWAGTNTRTSVFGIGIHCPNTFKRYCSTSGPCSARSSTEILSRESSRSMSQASATIRSRFTDFLPWSCFTGVSSTGPERASDCSGYDF